MTTVYLIRHAEAEGNIFRRCHGWYNSLLTENGYRQIESLSRRFQDIPIDEVYSSDLLRTMITAEAVCRPHGLKVHPERGLREIYGGVWEDRAWGELYHKYPGSLASFNRGDPVWQVEGSETFGALRLRVVRAIRQIAVREEGKTVAMVSHGAAIRTALSGMMGMPLDQAGSIPIGDNTCVACLEMEGDHTEIRYLNDNSHLGELSTLNRQNWWRKNGMDSYEEANLWFRPLEFAAESRFYYDAREDAWRSVHGTLNGFDGYGYLADARAHGKGNPDNVLMVMQGSRPVGVLQLDLQQEEQKKTGEIPFCYLIPDMRNKGYGIQLMGEAVSVYRKLGRQTLRLRCAPENGQGRRFYEKCGFRTVAQETGLFGSLNVLEKFIGYDLV